MQVLRNRLWLASGWWMNSRGARVTRKQRANVQNNGHGSPGWFLRLAIGALVLLSMLACGGPQGGPASAPDQESNLEIRTESSDLFEAVWRG